MLTCKLFQDPAQVFCLILDNLANPIQQLLLIYRKILTNGIVRSSSSTVLSSGLVHIESS